jgi:glycosyltransferase involved in cell wall biosynthesis
MRIGHWLRREKSGLAFTTLELVQAEEKRGHTVFLREPTDKEGLPGALLYGDESLDCDVECVHSQMPLTSYFGNRPRFLWAHGEPLSSVGNGVSMKAIVDMAPKIDAIIAMRKEEASIWSSIKRTYVVPKGIDLARFRPVEVAPHDEKDPRSKLSGEPAVIYGEHWRGQRNPLYLCVAMEKVWRKYPKARLHLFNATDPKMHATFLALHKHCKWFPFLRTISGPVADSDVNLLWNRADIACSMLYPLYARSIEAFGAGKPLICPGYRDPDYPYRCELDPDSIADAIIKAWETRGEFDGRKWAEEKHDVLNTVAACERIYERYLP